MDRDTILDVLTHIKDTTRRWNQAMNTSSSEYLDLDDIDTDTVALDIVDVYSDGDRDRVTIPFDAFINFDAVVQPILDKKKRDREAAQLRDKLSEERQLFDQYQQLKARFEP